MAKTWLSVTVELLGGRGDDLWPWPGRVFAVGPSHTFRDLANAINTAFGRWDHSHLSEFKLANGTLITDTETGLEAAGIESGAVITILDMDTQKVAKTLALGEEFQFVFDLGDNWVHRCVVEVEKIDPLETLGIRAAAPLPYWGWGNLPDQYGRRVQDDDGEQAIPPMPSEPHPMRTGSCWPTESKELDVRELRAARNGKDVARFMEAVRGCNIDSALQFIGAAGEMLLEDRTDEAEAFVLSVLNRLTKRSGPGDKELSEDLLALLRKEPYPGEALPVDLETLTMHLDEDREVIDGAYVNKLTGAVVANFVMELDDDYENEEFDDVEENSSNYLQLEHIDSRDSWSDMAAFADAQRNSELRDRLNVAIQGKGAFRAFRNIVYNDGLGNQWNQFSDERRTGRARAELAREGIRVVLPR